MRLGIQRQLIGICIITSLATGAVALLGHKSADAIWTRGKVLHEDYTDALRDLALGGQGLQQLSYSVRTAHTPGVGTVALQDNCDQAIDTVDSRSCR